MYRFSGVTKIPLFQYIPAKGLSLRENQGANSSDWPLIGAGGHRLQREAMMDLTGTENNL